MDRTTGIELVRKGSGGACVNRPNAPGEVSIPDHVSRSLQVERRGRRRQGSLSGESVALASAVEPRMLLVVDQHCKHETAFRHEHATEDQLLESAKSGDERAFVELTSRCVTRVRRRIFSIVRNHQDAEDALQDCLLRAYIHLHQFRGCSGFSTWIYRIAINSSVALLRKRKVRAAILSDRLEDDPSSCGAWDVPEGSPNPEQSYEKREALESLSRAVERLPFFYRSVVDYVYGKECSIQEAADAIGISVPAAKSRLMRARGMLRFTLEAQR